MNPSFPRGYLLARATSAARAATLNASLPNFLALMCLWMAAGLTLTGSVIHLTVTFLATVPTTEKTIRNLPIPFVLVLAAQFTFVYLVSALLLRLRTPVAILLFLLYAAGNGVWMAGISVLYVAIPLDMGFYVTAGMFALLAGLVFLTKADLLNPGSLPVMALIGGVVATVANLFLHGTVTALLVDGGCISVFISLFAYDRERLRWLAIGTSGAHERVRRVGLLGAVMLYFDLLNIVFLVFGGRERK